MPLSPREAFKTGFLARCAELGLGHAQMLAAAKEAADKVAGLFDAISGLGKTVANVGTGTVLPLALAAPPIIGGLAGLGLAKATDIGDEDVKAVKDQEVIDTYRTEAEKLRRQRLIRAAARGQAPRRGRPVM